jgi:hypothetical protein
MLPPLHRVGRNQQKVIFAGIIGFRNPSIGHLVHRESAVDWVYTAVIDYPILGVLRA